MNNSVSVKTYKVEFETSHEVGKTAVLYQFKLLDKSFVHFVGQYVWLIVDNLSFPDPRGERRAFTIISPPGSSHLEILARDSDSGYKKTLRSFKPGDTATVIGPYGSYLEFLNNNASSLVFISGGVAVAPFLAYVNSLTGKPENKVKLFHFYSDKSGKCDIPKFLEIIAQYDIEILNNEGKFNSDMFSGGLDYSKDHFLINGPQGFVNDVAKWLDEKGVPVGNRHFEEYFPEPVGNLKATDFDEEMAKKSLMLKAVNESKSHTIITDANGQILFANPRAQKNTGFSFLEMRGNTPRLWGGMMQSTFYRSFWEKKDEKENAGFDGVLKNRRKNNEVYTVLAHISPVTSSDGSIIGYVGTEEDISEQLAQQEELKRKNDELEMTKKAMINLLEDEKLLETKLKSERDRAQTIISSMGEGLLVVNKDFEVEIINEAAAKLLQVDIDFAVGKLWSEVVKAYHGTSQVPADERSFSRAMTEGRPFITKIQDDHYYETTSGIRFPVVSVTTPFYSEGKVVGGIKVFRDASLEKEEKDRIESMVKERTNELNLAKAQVSEALVQVQEEQARLSASITSLPIGFILADSNDQILISNPAAQHIISQKHELLDAKELLKNLGDRMAENYQTCHTLKKNIEVKDVNYQNKVLRIFFAPITLDTSEHKYLGTVILLEDVTEAKILERSKDEFFSIASHELRTPLTAIRGNTAMILDYFVADLKDSNLKELIQDVHESSLRLINIVNEFLDLSRLEQKKLVFKKEKVDLLALGREALEELKFTAHNGVMMTMENTPVALRYALADKVKTKEVLVNLIGNAVKYTEKGEVLIRLVEAQHFIEVQIRDTGRGISLPSQSLLFRKFQQAGENLYTRDTTKGTGLGLYISKLMVEGMGGQIKLVASEPGMGSTFSFTLPIWNKGANQD